MHGMHTAPIHPHAGSLATKTETVVIGARGKGLGAGGRSVHVHSGACPTGNLPACAASFLKGQSADEGLRTPGLPSE